MPLFAEELTRTVLEVGWLWEDEDVYELTGPLPSLAIPATLQDALRARLDRLKSVQALAPLDATLGREFAYELLQAISPWDEGTWHWCVTDCPPAPGGRQRTLHARPGPRASVPHGPRSGCGLPRLCRVDPLVAGVSGASPGPPPRGLGVGT
jgi:hypothetical protein